MFWSFSTRTLCCEINWRHIPPVSLDIAENCSETRIYHNFILQCDKHTAEIDWESNVILEMQALFTMQTIKQRISCKRFLLGFHSKQLSLLTSSTTGAKPKYGMISPPSWSLNFLDIGEKFRYGRTFGFSTKNARQPVVTFWKKPNIYNY